MLVVWGYGSDDVLSSCTKYVPKQQRINGSTEGVKDGVPSARFSCILCCSQSCINESFICKTALSTQLSLDVPENFVSNTNF